MSTTLKNKILITSLALAVLTVPIRAEMATRNDALTVANNWLRLIIQNKGSWGGSDTAMIQQIQQLKRGDRVLGYFCDVSPRGYIVVSLHKQLAPVKAYSAACNLNPASNKGMADLIKDRMEQILKRIDEWTATLKQPPDEVMTKILEINYAQAWAELNVGAATFQQMLDGDVIVMNYQEGDVLTTTSWHQRGPYNDLCPTGDTTCPDCCPDNPWVCNPSDPTVVGCVATAGAQIMRYWSWPPYGVSSNSYSWDGDDSCPAGGNPGAGAQTLSASFTDYYDWRRMANRYVWDGGQNRWEDENGNPLAQLNLDAVSELNYEVGIAVEMDYGCCGSGAYTSHMVDVYEDNYRYSTNCVKRDRGDYTAVQWFDRMKAQFNANRPVQYKIPGHSIVGDGWQEIGGGPTRQYHMNYGWDDGHTTWYTLDSITADPENDEYMVENIYPAQNLGSWLSGTYTEQSFPYRYFDRDATGSSAVFEAGQYLQFLPDITVTCTSTTGGSIRIYGASGNSTRLFTRGDRTQGARIYSGAIKLNRYGSIRFD